GFHLDAVVKLGDGEMVRDVVVPVDVAVNACARPDCEAESEHGLRGRGLGLHAQLEERLADVAVVGEREGVLDLQPHRQDTKYCALSASWVCVTASTTRSRNADEARRAERASSYDRSACSLPASRAAVDSSPPAVMRSRHSFTAALDARSERGECASDSRNATTRSPSIAAPRAPP